MSASKYISRKAAFLVSAGFTIAAILLLSCKLEVAPTIIPRVIVDMVNDHVDGNILPHNDKCEPVGAIKNRFAASNAPIALNHPIRFREFFANANLNSGSVVARFPAFFGASNFPGPCAIPSNALFLRREMGNRSILPSQNASIGVVIEAFANESYGKRINILDGTSRLTGDWSAVFSCWFKTHSNVMGFGFSTTLQPNTVKWCANIS